MPSVRPQLRTLVLSLILTTQMMIVLDMSIVITALPEIQADLDVSASSLSWIQNAYTLTFGGLLLLGARAGDVLGRRRVFLSGIALFSVASLLGGLASTEGWLIAARALQGVGGAIAAPATLAMLTTTFPAGPERMRAIAAYSAVSGAAASIGLVVGGLLTDLVSWRWGLFLNVPIGVLVILAAPRLLPAGERSRGHFDISGALTSVTGMTALVYAFVRASAEGWGDPLTIAAFASAAILIAAFLAIETQAEQPITPLRLFADRTRTGVLVIRVLAVSGMLSMFFFVTQYLQVARGYSPLEAGLAFLPVSAVIFGMSQMVPRLTGRFGDRRLLVAGLGAALVGLLGIGQLDATTAFFPSLMLPLLLLGFGMGTAFTPMTSLAVAGAHGVDPHDAGAASGLVNVAQQLGGSVGLAVVLAVFAGAGGETATTPVALSHAVATALIASAACMALALLVAIRVAWSPRRPAAAPEPAREALAEAVAEPVA